MCSKLEGGHNERGRVVRSINLGGSIGEAGQQISLRSGNSVSSKIQFALATGG